MPEITAPKACIHLPRSFQKKAGKMSHSNIWLWAGKFYQSKSQNENEGLAKKKKKRQLKNKEKLHAPGQKQPEVFHSLRYYTY